MPGPLCALICTPPFARAPLTRNVRGVRSAIRTVRSFAGEGLERERFAEHVAMSHRSGISFAQAKAMLESLNRRAYDSRR